MANDVKDKSQKRTGTTTRSWEKKKILAAAKPAAGVKRGDMIAGRVYNTIEDGAFIVTAEDYIGFIHNDEMVVPLQIDDEIEARVTFLRADGKLNLSLKPLKEEARHQDAEKIVAYLKGRKGSMPYTDVTPPETIKDVFGLSKAAFKRALGLLLKDGLVEQKEGWVTLKGYEEE